MTVAAMLTVHPFLAVTNPVPSKILVVEGWVSDYVLEAAKLEFEQHRYHKLYVTGGTIVAGAPLSEYKTYGELGAATLIRMGMSKNTVEAVPASYVRRDRTYASALSLKNYLLRQSSEETGLNLMSLGAHSRRSQLLFQKAFGENFRVGVIAIENREYDPKKWWKFSAGVRTVIDEFIAYIYAETIFSPE